MINGLIDNFLHQNLINTIKGKNIIIGNRGHRVGKTFCRYSPKVFNKVDDDIVDHCAVPLLTRPGYIKLDARNNIYRLYGREDISLSLKSKNLCNVTSKIIKMKLMEKQLDGNNQRADKHIISIDNNEKNTNFDLFSKTYCI